MQPKPFSAWMFLKARINDARQLQFFHEKDVWWCSMGCNVGSEEDGKNSNFSRPILIIKRFNSELCLALPLTSKPRSGRFYYSFHLNGNGQESTAILSQARVLDSRRLIRRMGRVSGRDFRNIRLKFMRLVLAIKTEALFS